MTHDLVNKIFMPYLANPYLQAGDDSAVIHLPSENLTDFSRIAFTTDSHVVDPLFFPGGDIGRLAISGTVNDLLALGATPLYLTAGFILEEGLSTEILQRVLLSMRNTALEAGVQIVAGDTKVVQKSKADGLYINTSGLGFIPKGVNISGANAHPGDVVIITGQIGSHGIAVLAARGDLGFETRIESDVAPLTSLVKSLLVTSSNIHVLRDPTRGGLGTTLNEIASQSNVGIRLVESQIPVHPAVRAACEMLGFDPLYIANEGKMIIIADQEDAETIIDCLHKQKYGQDAAVIGRVTVENPKRVLVHTNFGSNRLVDMLAGEILPRIC